MNIAAEIAYSFSFDSKFQKKKQHQILQAAAIPVVIDQTTETV